MADNSVLQGFMAGQQIRQKREQAAMEEEQRQQQHDLLQKQLDQEAKHQQMMADMQQKDNDLKMAQAKIALTHMYNSQQPLPKPGQAATQQQGPMHPGGLLDKLFPEGFQLDPNFQQNQLDLQRQSGQVEAQNAGAKAGAEAEAKLPSELKVKQAEGINQQNLEAGRAKSAANVANISGGYTLGAAQIRANAEREKNKANELDPEDLQGITDQISTGQVDMNQIPAKQKIGVLKNLVQSKQRPFTTKQAATMTQMNDLADTFKQIEQVANMLPESKLGVPFAYLQSNTIGSEKRAAINELGARVGTVLRSVAGLQGQRFTMPEVNKTIGAMADGTMTKAEAMKNLNDWKKTAQTHISDNILGGYTTEQKVKLKSLYTPQFGIKVKSPAGTIKYIDPNLVPEAIQKGGKVVE